MNTRSFTFAVLMAGVVMALLGNLPILNLVNCILCLWVWLSGALAVILYRRFQHGQPGPTGGQGAGLGAVAGLVGALVGFGVFVLTSAITTPILQSLARALSVEGDLPPQMMDGGGTFGGALFFLVINIVLYPLFGALGGLITANLGNKSSTSPV